MYYYIYDAFLGDKKYNGVLARIENRLTDLGINGKVNRLSFLKNINQILSEEIKRGAKTVVVVGDDRTLGQIINLIQNFNLTFGFIPVGPSRIAQLLNIPAEEKACDILSARIIKKIDLGEINNYYFISGLQTGGREATIICDNSYYVDLKDKNNIVSINNLDHSPKMENLMETNGLEIVIESIKKNFLQSKQSTFSKLNAKLIQIVSDKAMPVLLLDEKKIIKTPVKIKISSEKLKIITGKISD